MFCFRVTSWFARHICPLLTYHSASLRVRCPPFAPREEQRAENRRRTTSTWALIKIFIPTSGSSPPNSAHAGIWGRTGGGYLHGLCLRSLADYPFFLPGPYWYHQAEPSASSNSIFSSSSLVHGPRRSIQRRGKAILESVYRVGGSSRAGIGSRRGSCSSSNVTRSGCTTFVRF